MEQTYTVLAYNLAVAADTSMFAIFNSGSSVVIRVYRIWANNLLLTAVTGNEYRLHFYRITNLVGGTSLLSSVVKHDTTNADIDGSVSIATGGTATYGSVFFRRVIRYGDEIASGGGTIEEVENLFNIGAMIWDSGFGNSSVKPLTFRQNEGLTIQTLTDPDEAYAGFYTNIMVEFTQSSS